jgi:hypothetical protein
MTGPGCDQTVALRDKNTTQLSGFARKPGFRPVTGDTATAMKKAGLKSPPLQKCRFDAC